MIFFISFFFNFVFACEINFPEKIILLKKNIQESHDIHFSNCDQDLKKLVYDQLNSKEKIKEIELKSMSDGQILKIFPSIVEIEHIDQFINSIKSTEYKIKNHSSSMTTIGLKKNEFLRFSHLSSNSLHFMISDQLGKVSEKKLDIETAPLIKVWKLNKTIRPFQPISANDLSEDFIPLHQQHNFLTDISELIFFQTNKEITESSLLKKSDLSSLNLVKAGLETEILLENDLLKIKTRGISRSHGKIGEMVEVYQPHTQKKFQGKVIDFNRIHVQL